jgi:integrase/recombinase XerD
MTNIEMYEQYLISEKKSDKTIKAYLDNVNQMLNIIGKSEKDIDFVDFTNWKNSIGNLAPASINQKIASVRHYFKWLKAMHFVDDNITVEINRVKEYQVKEHEYVPMEDMKALINYGKNSRDKAIIATFLSTGVRANELINFTLDDYNKPTCDIVAKGKVTRHIVWTPDNRKYIDAYLIDRKNCNINNLFVSNQGTKMNEESMLRTVKKIAERAGIEANVCLHSMRHSCISNICDNFGIAAAKTFVNHSNIAITQKYAHNTAKQIENMAMSINL